jgi:hypothetical protein
MHALPSAASRNTFEWTGQIGRDPTAVEIALLRLHALVIHKTGIYAIGIKRQMIAHGCIGFARRRITPCRGGGNAIAHHQIPIMRAAFELAERPRFVRPQKFIPHVLRRNVIGGRVARLQDSKSPCGIGHDFTAVLYPNALPASL